MKWPVFIIALLFACCACSNNTTSKAERTSVSSHEALSPQYYFYPKANVYYDSINKDYVFLGSDGKTWTTQKQIPAAVQSMMDKSVLIESPSQPVWKDNANHKLIYSAALYMSSNDTVEKKEPVAKPVATDSAVKKEEHKSGIRRFFDKLFGRKKKNKEKVKVS